MKRYDSFRKIVNPILSKLFNLELVKITSNEGKFIGVGIRLAVWIVLLLVVGLGCMTSAMVADLPEATPSVTMVAVSPSLVPSPSFQDGEGGELSDYVKMPQEFEVCTDVLHVRSNPFVAEGNVVGWLERGTVVLVHEMFEGWGRLAGLNEERVRWVKLEFLCRL